MIISSFALFAVILPADRQGMAAPARDVNMSTPAPLTIDLGPDWMATEMPPGYGTRLAEIQRLTADLHAMTRFGRLLYAVGPQLTDAVRDMFGALGFETDVLGDPAEAAIAVRVDNWSRLLLHVAGDGQVIERKSPEIGHVFQLVQQIAEGHDHVAFVTNSEPAVRPADRHDALTPEAHELLNRMGASHVPAATLFAIWKLSLEERERARELVQRLHKHGGGTFELPPSARLI